MKIDKFQRGLDHTSKLPGLDPRIADRGIVRWYVETIAGKDGTFPPGAVEETFQHGLLHEPELGLVRGRLSELRRLRDNVMNAIVEGCARGDTWKTLDFAEVRLTAGRAVLEAISHAYDGVYAKEPPSRPKSPAGMPEGM